MKLLRAFRALNTCCVVRSPSNMGGICYYTRTRAMVLITTAMRIVGRARTSLGLNGIQPDIQYTGGIYRAGVGYDSVARSDKTAEPQQHGKPLRVCVPYGQGSRVYRAKPFAVKKHLALDGFQSQFDGSCTKVNGRGMVSRLREESRYHPPVSTTSDRTSCPRPCRWPARRTTVLPWHTRVTPLRDTDASGLNWQPKQ